MQNDLTFSVAVSTFNRNDDLARCLQALEKQTYKDFDIVIANGGNFEGVKRAVDKFNKLRIKIVNQQRRGVVEARNLGWRHSNADIVCFIDDDLVVETEWLKNIRDTFLTDDYIGGVSGPTIIPDDRQKNRDLALFLGEFKKSKNIFLKLLGSVYLRIILENKISDVGKILKSGAFTPGSNFKSCLSLSGLQDIDYLEACHMCFRRKLLEEIGGFDYIYEGTGEWNEPDFSFRVRSCGWRLVFNPRAVTYHYISQGGVFGARTNSYERSRNFIFFYMRWVKPNSFEKIVRFGINLLFINLYWCYKFLQSGNIDWLRGISGSFSGLADSLRSPFRLEKGKYARLV